MASEQLTSTIMVMVGITGDLAQRYLLPAITALAQAERLPQDFKLIGVSRRDVTTASVLDKQAERAFLQEHLEMRQMDLDDETAYHELADALDKLEAHMDGEVHRIFYLSVPPSVSSPIIQHLGAAKLAQAGTTKLMMEKPFGSDLASAKALVEHLTKHFDEDQIYRIDHYVAKEMVQNIVTLRRNNAAIDALWQGSQVQSVQILVSEAIDIEGRGTFYEQTGALRDLIQSHILQILAHVVMEVPQDDTDIEALRAARLQALHSLKLASSDVLSVAKRGQYNGYRTEVENDESMTETFADLTFHSDVPMWHHVPLRLTTGKALDQRLAHVVLNFCSPQTQEHCGSLTLRIQPDAQIALDIEMKRPGYDDATIRRALTYDYVPSDGQEVDAYERVMLDALRGDHHLFISSAEVIASWELIDPVQRAWADSQRDLRFYDKGATPDSVDDAAPSS